MEFMAKGNKDFLRIMRLAGIPEGTGDINIIQSGERSGARWKVTVRWEA